VAYGQPWDLPVAVVNLDCIADLPGLPSARDRKFELED